MQLQTWDRGSYRVSTDPSLLQLDRIHHSLSHLYWCEGIPFETVKRACENSLCFGVYEKGPEGLKQAGLARVISDYTTFAYLCDVYIDEVYRGKGLSKWMMSCVRSHPSLQGLRRFTLATRDAHGLYSQFGFKVTDMPERWMEIMDRDVYKRASTPN